jgi:hypothetical protein
MSTAVKQVMIDDWRCLYEQALASVTSTSMSEQIASAEKAIIIRMGQLRGSSLESSEWLAVTDALRALSALKSQRLMSWLGSTIPLQPE